MHHDSMRGGLPPTRRRKPQAIACCLTLLLVLVPRATTHAQDRADAGGVAVTGRVLDEVTRTPLQGVLVHLPDLEVSVHTDEDGRFKLQDLRTGVYEMELTREGYQRSVGDFTVDRGGLFVTTLTPLGDEYTILPGRFIGRVTDGGSGDPVGGVDVHIAEIFISVATNDSGRFAVNKLPAGRYAVKFSSLGYATQVDTVDILSGQTSDARVHLALTPIEIEPIQVTVEPREMVLEDVGFYQRRTIGFGKFIDRTAIEERGPYRMTDLFRGIPGVDLIPASGFANAVLLRGGKGNLSGICYPSVVLDGIVVHFGKPGKLPALIDNLINPELVAGIEIFVTSVGTPVQYSGIMAGCGVIVIWTRRS